MNDNVISLIDEQDSDLIDSKFSFYIVVKRLIDILISFIALIVLSPLFLIICVAIKLESKGKAIYTQERIGLNGKNFKIYKFRSMVLNADELLNEILANDENARAEYEIKKKLTNDPRITKVGKFIRKTSLDELPQLINVLNGTMSLVGNRPYLPKEKVDMGPYYNMIIKTKPGITGLWQVSGRSNTTFATRCSIESNYSRNFSLKEDIRIFFKTFKVVFKGIGAK